MSSTSWRHGHGLLIGGKQVLRWHLDQEDGVNIQQIIRFDIRVYWIEDSNKHISYILVTCELSMRKNRRKPLLHFQMSSLANIANNSGDKGAFKGQVRMHFFKTIKQIIMLCCCSIGSFETNKCSDYWLVKVNVKLVFKMVNWSPFNSSIDSHLFDLGWN